MHSANYSKKQLRKQMLNRRDTIAPKQLEAWSWQITRRVLGLDCIDSAKSIFCYLSFGSEVATFELIEALLDKEKKIAVPKITDYKNGVMEPHQIMALDNLKRNKLGALEPVDGGRDKYKDGRRTDACPTDARPTGCFDIVLAPGAAFTKRGERLGMGAGFYDRYLAAHKPKKIIALSFEKQIVDSLPHEKHDIKMDLVVSESETLKC